LGSPQYPVRGGLGQSSSVSARSFRCRRCLLKDCERFYRPTHPQSRYCSAACRLAARRWRRWQASRTWRASARGQKCRREQCRRYRRRIPLVVLTEPPPLTSPSTVAACEGQRPATKPEDFSTRACERPGCYERFTTTSEWSPQRFCGPLCRRALRRVLDREARYRQRRRAGDRPARPPPKPRS
jgi:hypothetical protein